MKKNTPGRGVRPGRDIGAFDNVELWSWFIAAFRKVHNETVGH
jgi:hypothetical protein